MIQFMNRSFRDISGTTGKEAQSCDHCLHTASFSARNDADVTHRIHGGKRHVSNLVSHAAWPGEGQRIGTAAP